MEVEINLRVKNSIKIGNITVVFISTQGNKVRIGVEAPSDVEVHRQEIWNRIQEEKRKEAIECPR